MRLIRAAASQVVGLFVGDWTQTITSVAILGIGWFALARWRVAGLAFAIAVALGVQLIVATLLQARGTALEVKTSQH